MELASLLPSSVAEVLARGGTILTGNQRAARTLRLAFDRQCRANGLYSWQPPHIYAWETWTKQLWRQALLAGASDNLLLNRTQELRLWRSIISADPQWASLRTAGSLAEMAASAWHLLCAYRGQSRLGALGVSEDTRAFQRWAQSFIRRCKSDGYLSQSELETALASFAAFANLQLASEILLIGFDSKTPAQVGLLDVLQSAGIETADQPAPPMAVSRHLAASVTLDDELAQAALWLRGTLESKPEARIAVIHPDIASERSEIDRVFRGILAPELQSAAAGLAGGPFEFSLGEPLSRAPMVVVALKLLRWVTAPLQIEEISNLLLSPYFTSASELQARAEFDACELRRSTLLQPELTLTHFIALIEGRAKFNCHAGLLSQLRSLNRTATQLLSDSAKQRSFSDWADSMRELMISAGLAGAYRDDSVAFQTRRKWDSALDELSTLDFEGTRPTFPEALVQLEGILQRTLFAPESREAPIQIMGPQEAAGSCFDAVYFVRASDLVWPLTCSTNPLLGWRLQRELGIPGSDPVRDLEHAKAVTVRLAASTPLIVFSYAQETADGHQRPSPLLEDLALEQLRPASKLESTAATGLEEIEDPGFIPLADLRVRGGATVLQLQAACGFRAFAEIRLNSAPLCVLEPGMDAAERGRIVHDALDQLWGELGTQAALASLTPEARSAQIHRSVASGLRRFMSIAAGPWETAYLELQHERLYRLLSSWLDIELTRQPFEVKLREQVLDVAIGTLLLSIRVDRVDRSLNEVENATEIIIDYKTGVAHPSAWNGDRPDEPQLPLYAAVRSPGTVAAVAFAQLRPGHDMSLKGIAARERLLPRQIKLEHDSLEAQIAEWRTILTSLAEDFANGDARVRPKDPVKTCEFCAQRILCRVDPALLDETLDEPDEDDEKEADVATLTL